MQKTGEDGKKLISKNRGSSLITVLAVITIVMVVVFSVLAMAYRYYMSESGSIYRQKGDEAARSLSEELGDELMKTNCTTAEQAAAAGGLWKYLRSHMGQPGWKYYNSGKFTERKAYDGGSDVYVVNLSELEATTLEAAKKNFSLEALPNGGDSGISDEVPEMDVALYWEPGKYTDRLNDSRLYIEVSCRMGDHVTVITKRYKLSTLPFAEGNNSLEAAEDGGYKYQNWVWIYDGEI